MEKDLVVGTGRATKGMRAHGAIPVGTRGGGGSIEIPLIIINGAEDGPVLWIDGAVHGDELEGPYALLRLMEQLDPSTLRGAVVAVPAVNVPAFEVTQHGNPADPYAYDLGRIYPGRPDGYLSERIAYAHYTALVEVADMEISVHSGGTDDCMGCAQVFTPTPAGLELAKAMGPQWDLLMKASGDRGTQGAMTRHGKPATTVELGGLCETFPTQLQTNGETLVRSFLNVMKHYKMIDGTPEYATRWFVGHEGATILAPASGLWIAEPQAVPQHVRKGDRMARILSLHGDVIADIRCPFDGILFGLRTNPSVQLGDRCLYIAVVEDELKQ